MHRFLMAGMLAIQKGTDAFVEEGLEWGKMMDEAEGMFADELEEFKAMLQESLTIVRSYFEQADWTDWEILHVEEEFSVTIDAEPVTFTPDLVARDRNGKVWVWDHKSTSSVPQNGIPFASQQSLLYLAGVRVFYPEAAGFIFNFLRKKLPMQPRLNKTKKKADAFYAINNLNKIDTTYEILMAFVRDEAPELTADLDTKRRLAELRDNPSRFFYEETVMVTDQALVNIVEDSSMVIKNISGSEMRGEYPRTLIEDGGYRSCGRCEFNAICQAEMLDWNTDIVLEMYEDRDPKNEYETEDE